MSDTPPSPPDDDTRAFGTPQQEQSEAQQPQPQPAGQPVGQPVGQPAGQPVGPPYAAPYGVPQYAGYPAYLGYPPPPQRPKLSDQVLGMRAVIAVALAALVIGGLGGALLGALTSGNDDTSFGGPSGFPQGGFGQLPNQGQLPQQQFGQNQP
jgi:hypothetical protein